MDRQSDRQTDIGMKRTDKKMAYLFAYLDIDIDIDK
jgi:hypothetical protein